LPARTRFACAKSCKGGSVACRHAALPRVGMSGRAKSLAFSKHAQDQAMSACPPRKQKYKTCRRYNTPGDSHALTFNCFHGQAFLSKDRTRLWLIDSLCRASERLQFDIWAYVIMPEHCHILVCFRNAAYSISRVLEAIKLPVTRRARSFLEHTAPESLHRMRDQQPSGRVAYRFWQRGGGHDRNLFEPNAVHAKIEYIHNNPVRRGLVARPEDWRWSSAARYAGIRDVPLTPDADSIPPLHPA
jgi:putative transposase